MIVLLNVLGRTFSCYGNVLASSQLGQELCHFVFVSLVDLALLRFDVFTLVYDLRVDETINFKRPRPLLQRLRT